MLNTAAWKPWCRIAQTGCLFCRDTDKEEERTVHFWSAWRRSCQDHGKISQGPSCLNYFKCLVYSNIHTTEIVCFCINGGFAGLISFIVTYLRSKNHVIPHACSFCGATIASHRQAEVCWQLFLQHPRNHKHERLVRSVYLTGMHTCF